MKRMLVAVLVLSLGLAACGGGAEAGLPDGAWRLVEGTTSTGPIAPVPGAAVTIQFSEGRFAGGGGCNGYGGSATLDGDRVTVGEIDSSVVACSDPAIMEVEERHIDALRQVSAIEASDETLTLSGPDVTLTVRRDYSVRTEPG